MRPCDGSSTLRGRNAQPRPPPRRCSVRPGWVFRCSVVHRDPRRPLLISRNLTIPRPISASFLAKRKCKTSVSPRSISSIGKTLAAACNWPGDGVVAAAAEVAAGAAASEVAAVAGLLAAEVAAAGSLAAEAARVAAAVRVAAAARVAAVARVAAAARVAAVARARGERAAIAGAKSQEKRRCDGRVKPPPLAALPKGLCFRFDLAVPC